MFDKSGSKKRRDRSRSPVNRRGFENNQSRGGGGGGMGMGNGPGPMFNANGPVGMGMAVVGGQSSGPIQPAPAQQVNDVEIIVISKDQWYETYYYSMLFYAVEKQPCNTMLFFLASLHD